jgi:hypothetical protein
MVWLEGPEKVLDTLAGMGSEAAHQAELGMPVQPSRLMPETMIGDR